MSVLVILHRDRFLQIYRGSSLFGDVTKGHEFSTDNTEVPAASCLKTLKAGRDQLLRVEDKLETLTLQSPPLWVKAPWK